MGKEEGEGGKEKGMGRDERPPDFELATGLNLGQVVRTYVPLSLSPSRMNLVPAKGR